LKRRSARPEDFLIRTVRIIAALLFLGLGAQVSSRPAAEGVWPPDPGGRHIIPHGFVVLTGDLASEYNYTPADYQRMVSLGANFQVIRIFGGEMGAWPGYSLKQGYLDKLQRMVQLGKKAGLQTSFKMTIYDIKGSGRSDTNAYTFSEDDWTDFWLNKAGRQEIMIEAWRRLFEHFKNEPAVVGYDILNESNKGKLEIDFARYASDYLVPYYRRVIDVLHKVSPQQWAMYQPPIGAQPMPVPLDRPRIVYAPHLYPDFRDYLASGGTPDPSKYAPLLDRVEREAALSKAPLCIMEYGNPALLANDTVLEKQILHANGERAAVAEFDRRALGSVRPWFCVTRRVSTRGNFKLTWGMFLGDSDAGGPERKYILDVFARPIPLVTAGRVETFGFDFATRHFEMKFTPDSAKGESEIFVPRERHFPDGFRVVHGKGLTLVYDPSAASGFRVIANPNQLDATVYRWDAPPGTFRSAAAGVS